MYITESEVRTDPARGSNLPCRKIVNGRGHRYDPMVADACMALFRSGFMLSAE